MIKNIMVILTLSILFISVLQNNAYCGESESIAFKVTLGTSFGGLLGYLSGSFIIQQDEPLNKKQAIILGSSTLAGALYAANSISKNTVEGTNLSYVRVRNGTYIGVGVGLISSYLVNKLDKKAEIGRVNPWTFYINILSIYGGAYIGASKRF